VTHPPRLLPLKTAQPPLSTALQKHQEVKARELATAMWPFKEDGDLMGYNINIYIYIINNC
jgi:hypothetical protein